MKKFHIPIPLIAAAAFTMAGCLGVAPKNVPQLDGSLSATTKSAWATSAVLKFAPLTERETMAAGSYSTVIKLMYTEAYMRVGNYDYHIGLDQNAETKGQKLNFGTPLVATESGSPVHFYYASAPSADDPIFSTLNTATCSDPAANPASDSVDTGAYFLGPGIYRFPASGSTPVDIMFENASNSSFVSATSSLATFSSPADQQMLNVRPCFESLDSLFLNIFQDLQVVTLSGIAYTLPVLTSVPSSIGNGYILVNNRTIKTQKYGGSSYTATYYKIVLPGTNGISEIRFPCLPLGRLVVEIRRYNDIFTLGSYGYGQFLLKPTNNVLDVGEIH
jgi:hypothetical protein